MSAKQLRFISISCSSIWSSSPQPLLQVIISPTCVLFHPLLCQPLPSRTGTASAWFAVHNMELYRLNKETRGTACFALHGEGSRSGQEVMVATGSRRAVIETHQQVCELCTSGLKFPLLPHVRAQQGAKLHIRLFFKWYFNLGDKTRHRSFSFF